MTEKAPLDSSTQAKTQNTKRNGISEWTKPKKTDPDYGDWIEFVKLRHARRLQNLQIKLIILTAILAAGIILIGNNKVIIALLLFGFAILTVLLYIDERKSLDYLEKDVYENAQHYPIHKSLRGWIFNISFTIYVCIIAYLTLNVLGIFPANVNTPQLTITGYNQTSYPNEYHITIQNIGQNSSQAFSFYITPLNKSVNITYLSWKYLNVTPLWIGVDNKSVYLEIGPMQAKSVGIINFTLSSKSKVSLNPIESPDTQCNGIFYGLNEYGNITENTIYEGNCTQSSIASLIFSIHSPRPLPAYLTCSNTTIGIFPNNLTVGSVNFEIPSNRASQLVYYLYKNNQLLKTLQPNTYNSISINLTATERPSIFEIYTPGNKNYTCSAIVLGYGINKTN